jgi:hypothetical protein
LTIFWTVLLLRPRGKAVRDGMVVGSCITL